MQGARGAGAENLLFACEQQLPDRVLAAHQQPAVLQHASKWCWGGQHRRNSRVCLMAVRVSAVASAVAAASIAAATVAAVDAATAAATLLRILQ